MGTTCLGNGLPSVACFLSSVSMQHVAYRLGGRACGMAENSHTYVAAKYREKPSLCLCIHRTIFQPSHSCLCLGLGLTCL